MKIDRIQHMAYRCKDGKETVLCYETKCAPKRAAFLHQREVKQ